MARLRWTAEAELSLRDIHNHIAQNRPATARRTVESILNRVESLRQAPELGQPWPEPRVGASGGHHPRRQGIRRLTYGQFQIAYLFDDPEEVVVLGVFHGLIFLPLK